MRRYSSYFQPMMKNVKGILKEFVINKLIKGTMIVTGIFDALFTTFNQLLNDQNQSKSNSIQIAK